MSDERKKPCWAFRANVASIVLLFGYPASLVPLALAHGMMGGLPEWLTNVLRAVYSPFGISIFDMTFAAFCVWLTVRLINRRERWAKRTLAVIIGSLIYPLSFGPVAGLAYREMLPEWAPGVIGILYYPVQIIFCSTEQGGEIYMWYVSLWVR